MDTLDDILNEIDFDDPRRLPFSVRVAIAVKNIRLGGRIPLSQRQLAEKIGTKRSTITRLESKSANPTIALLDKIAKATNSHLVIRFEK